MAGEMLEFENGISAQVMNLEENSIGAVILGDYLEIRDVRWPST
jgi:F-type H+-transporting ATPase subunit alpha